MRWFAAFAILTAAPAVAEPSRCSVQGPMETAQIDAPSLQAAPAAGAAMSAASPTTGPAAHPISPNLAGVAFLQHVAAAGATLFDLGVAGGRPLTWAAARSGDESEVSRCCRAGRRRSKARPSSLASRNSPPLLRATSPPRWARRPASPGISRAAASNSRCYAAPDNSVVVPGILRDAEGRRLHPRPGGRRHPRRHPDGRGLRGYRPVRRYGRRADGSEPCRHASRPRGRGKVGLRNDRASIGAAVVHADRPTVRFIYSVRSYKMLRGYTQAGQDPALGRAAVGTLDYEDQGQSTRSALALLSKPPDQILSAWQAGDVAGPIAPDAATGCVRTWPSPRRSA